MVADPAYVLVVSLTPSDTSCTLFFGRLADRAPGTLRILQFGVDDVAGALAGASAVILVRGLFELGHLAACAKRLGVPRYYFLDDNFMLIRDEMNTYGRSYEQYSNDRVRTVLRDFSGVLLATPSLMKYFAAERLHDHLMLYLPVAGGVLESPARDGDHPLTVAFFGGMHRRDPFVRFVYPSVCRLARDRKVKLIAAGLEAGRLAPAAGVEIVYPPYDPSYTAAVQLVARFGVDILVHPSSATANNIYKNPHVLINARALGAAPIFSNVPPYDAVAGEQVALLCENTEDAWYEAIAGLASDARLRQTLQARLAAYCGRQFGGDTNADVIRGILSAHPAPDPSVIAARRLSGSICLAVGHVKRRIEGMLARLRRTWGRATRWR